MYGGFYFQMPSTDYYILLGINRNASLTEIKNAYRELAKKYHPDKNFGDKNIEEYFKEIQQAYAVLSHPEKRKKYDLKFLYGTKSNYSQTTYKGNAYQYAQQQAQYKQKYTQATYKKRQQSNDKTESLQILISVGVALILLYFIISYSSEKSKTIAAPITERISNSIPEEQETEPVIRNFDSPYSNFFGEEVYINGSKNHITFYNSNESEAVVCLVENRKPNKTIRNEYINRGTSFNMNNIPNGEYYLKIYYGSDWDPSKTFLNNKVRGGFKNEICFAKMNTSPVILKMKQQEAGTSTSFSSYEIGLNPYNREQTKYIKAEEFFNN